MNPLHDQCHMRDKCQQFDVCPMTLVQKLLSGKWKILILWYLSYNILRFSDLQKLLPDVTTKMLTQPLRSLEKDNLIYRKVYPVVPPKVEYSLSDIGKRVIPILTMMHGFGSEYLLNEVGSEISSC